MTLTSITPKIGVPMSKRSSRRKRKLQQKKQQTRLTAPILLKQGLKAFEQADYDEAIKFWEQARKKPTAPTTLPAALAEACFRRAINTPSPGLADLRQANQLQPNDPRYRYHLALAYHRDGGLKQAEPLYRQLLAMSPPFTRAAAPLAQLLIEQKKTVTKDPVWQQLNPTEQTQLTAADALIKKKTASSLSKLAAQALDPFWAGLIALALKNKFTAQEKLQQLVNSADQFHPLTRAVANYYLGTIAAQAGQMDIALSHWQTSQANGFDSQPLRKNLAAMAYDQAIKAYQAGQPQQAAELLNQFEHAEGGNSNLHAFQQQLDLELGYLAAKKNDWNTALDYWKNAEDNGDDSRKLIFNLALTYQSLEQYNFAADYWRTLLRRRPRKIGHPDTLTDQQVARIWQNIAENYNKAGEYEEAIKTYKNAVKWAPDNLELRLKLVESYQNEGRWQAAENEINRVLEKNPDHIPALILLAESYSQDYFPQNARRLWNRILKLEPQNPIARQQLAHSYVQEGSNFASWGQYQRAIATYEEGLKQIPNNQNLLTMIGGTYADWNKKKQAREYFEKAIAVNPNDLQTLHKIYVIWLHNYSAKDLQQTFEHIKTVNLPTPGDIYLDLFEHCRDLDRMKEGRQLLEYVKEHYPDDLDSQVMVATCYIDLDEENTALPILRSVIKKNPTHIEANIQLGIVYYYLDQTRLAKRHWSKAQSQAKKENDHLALYKVKTIKDEFLYGKRVPTNPLEIIKSLPPELRDEIFSQAPPEIAEAMKKMGPDALEILMGMGGFMDDEEDEFFYE